MSYTNQQRARDWRFIWATPEGRRAISDLLASCGVFGLPSPSVPVDPIALHISLGRQGVAHDIVQWLGVTPEQFEKITEAMMENIEDE